MLNLKERFPFFANKNQIYFDSGATTLKPSQVIEAQTLFLTTNGANPHSNDYQESYLANELLKNARIATQKLINALDWQEIVFTSSTTHALNQVAFGLIDTIEENDEIIITELEHSSNMLPWIELANQKKAIIKTFQLSANLTIDIEAISQQITPKTKVVSFAHISNTIGNENDICKIVQQIRLINPRVIIVVDVAQSIAHTKIDVQAWDVDFIAFSAHKMYGPFGLGILYGKYEILDTLKPLMYGGGMNKSIQSDYHTYSLETLPNKLEAGTLNISAIPAYLSAIDFLNEIGIEEIRNHEIELKKYFRHQVYQNHLEEKFSFYNLQFDNAIILMNKNHANPQDIATYFDAKFNISSRSGKHCARTTEQAFASKATLRVSFGVYNTFADIDQLILAMQSADNYLEIY